MCSRSSSVRSKLARSFSILVIVAIAACANAASFTLTSSDPTTNWSDSTKWNNGTGSAYPGQAAGDVVTVPLSGFTLNVDVAIANPVQLNITGSDVAITVPAAGSLMLLNSSGVVSSDSLTINGGTFGVAAGNSLPSWAGPITMNGGHMNLHGALSVITGLTISGYGYVTTDFPLTLQGNNVMSNGSIGGSGGVTIASGATLAVTGPSASVGPLTNNGTIDFQVDGTVGGDLHNRGILKKSGGSGVTNLSAAPFVNDGTIVAQSGTIGFFEFTQNSGVTSLEGGNISCVWAMVYAGGTFTGSGTIAGSIDNSGATFDPGTPSTPGTLTFATDPYSLPGSYNQFGNGTLVVDLFGNGSNDSVIANASYISLGGILKVRLEGGYSPSNLDSYVVAKAQFSIAPKSPLQFQFPQYGPSNTGTFHFTSSSVQVLTAFIPSADLSIAANAADAVPITSTWPVTLTIENHDAANGTLAEVSLAATNGTISNASSSAFICSGAGASWSCNTTSPLLPGATKTITVTMTPATVGTVTLTSTLSSSIVDPVPSSNTATASASVTGVADLSIVKHAPVNASPGGSITYHLDVANYGPSDAANVVVTDPTPAGLTFVSVTGGCSAFPCKLGTMTSGQTRTLTVVYDVAADLSGIVNNTAIVSSDLSDPVSANNTAHAFTTLTTVPACAPPDAPVPSVVASTLSAETYDVQWPAVDGATQYEVDESTDANFTSPFTRTVTTTIVSFAHGAQSAQTYYYRVRALADCGEFSAYSPMVHVIIVPPARRRAVRP